MQDPPASQSLPRLGCLLGTLSPSRRQIRSTLVVDRPARLPQQSSDLAVAIATILPGQLDDIGSKPLLIVPTARHFALRRAVLPERRTDATLGNRQLRADLFNAGAATRGA